MKKIKFVALFIMSLFSMRIFYSIFFKDKKRSLSGFSSKEGESLYMQAYEESLKRMPEPTSEGFVKTSYGNVKYYVYGTLNEDSTPLLLFPGRNSGAPMWFENIEGLIKWRNVIMIDAIGDSGLSTQTKAIEDDKDQALWIHQLITHLKIKNVHSVGHSFGGWLASNHAKHYPDDIKSLSLLEPVFVVEGLKPIIYLKSIPATLPFLPKKFKEDLLKEISGSNEIDLKDSVARMIYYSSEYFSLKLPMPKKITGEDLNKINKAIYIAVADKSSLHDSEEIVRKSTEQIKQLKIKNWKNATHSLPMEYPIEINEAILNNTKE